MKAKVRRQESQQKPRCDGKKANKSQGRTGEKAKESQQKPMKANLVEKAAPARPAAGPPTQEAPA